MNQKQKFDAIELRKEIFEGQGYRCAHCHGPLNAKNTPQLAHRIAQTKNNLKKYGDDVINHRLNLVAVCCVEPCNSSMNIGHNPGKVSELLEKIALAMYPE